MPNDDFDFDPFSGSSELDNGFDDFDPLADVQTIAPSQIAQPAQPAQAGDIELGTAEELNDILSAFKARARAEQRRFELATDSEYWFCVCFQTREQKEAFLKAVEWFEHGDKYLDGQWVARQMGVNLPRGDVPYNTGRVDRRLATVAQDLNNE